MNKESIFPYNEVSFKDYLIKNKRNRIILCMSVAAIAIQFAIFKYFYPYASYIHGDSFVYLQTAYRNLDINNYMVGYSRFLRLFSVFTRSDTALVCFQYIFIQCSSLFFLLTLFYFYKTNFITRIILFCFMVFNPLFLYLANYVSSDGYFLALSFSWFSSLIWILNKPSWKIILIHAILIYICFTVRNNALIYPIISVAAFSLSIMRKRTKLLGFAIPIIIICCFIAYTGNKFKSLTGIWQYSPFSGWQLANNGMYAYRYVNPKIRNPVPNKFSQLDRMVTDYFDSTRNLLQHPTEALMASTVYMWYSKSPLQMYMNRQFSHDSVSENRKKWAAMAPLYKEYGIHLIKQYPVHFLKYFIWPNANKFFAPPVEFLEDYNMGVDTVAPVAQIWFNYSSNKVKTRTSDLSIHTLDYYPILAGVMNLVLVCSLVCFLTLSGFKTDSHFRKIVLLVIFTWLVNSAFTILASSAALRFQSFPILLTCNFSFILIDWIINKSLTMEVEEKIEKKRLKHLAPNAI